MLLVSVGLAVGLVVDVKVVADDVDDRDGDDFSASRLIFVRVCAHVCSLCRRAFGAGRGDDFFPLPTLTILCAAIVHASVRSQGRAEF